ncbi:Calcineurin-like phosphoesterase [Singulisphaera sp. GP187]|uniref:metallophosphoesterase n=1 Tax=Singulisphaera sp. GP187 TaxID=1882752 RepID=UPI0009295915|nr:metallophosphoesterase [Singulisphaera sp. GP187]SIO35676.1 Calcineurin-like phosphoesterase [Singulisphaera sp. GP187]
MKLSRPLIALAWSLLVFAPLVQAGNPTPRAVSNAPDGAFVVKPYLQIGRTPAPDTLQLLWHAPDTDTDTDADWSVEHRAAADRPWGKADTLDFVPVAVAGIEPHRVYRAALTGLVPGGSFAYRVLKGGEAVFSAEARAPKRADQPFRFVAFGDCGAGTPEQKPLAHRAYLSKPDLAVIPGDMVYEYGLISEYREKFWPVYNAESPTESGSPLLRSVPFVAAPGNHDTEIRDLDKYPDALAYYLVWDQPLNGPLGEEGGPFVPSLKGSEANQRAFTKAAGKAYPRMTNFSFNYGNAHWTIVDSNPYVDWTDAKLKEWVAADLASAKDATWRFVAFHHPGFNSANEHIEQQHMRLLAPILEAGKVDIVFSGHVHNYQRSFPLRFEPLKQGTLMVGGRDRKTVRGRVVPGRWTLDQSFDGKTDTSPEGVIYIVTGAGGQKLYNPEQNDDPDSWQKFTDKFVSNAHSLTVADVDGKTLTIRQLTAEGKEVDRFVVTK